MFMQQELGKTRYSYVAATFLQVDVASTSGTDHVIMHTDWPAHVTCAWRKWTLGEAPHESRSYIRSHKSKFVHVY